jgi:membrane protein YqaA with SNARE-associated domain
MHPYAAFLFKKTFWHLLRRLGGPGLILLGVVDNSVVPVPGSMDALAIVLAATHKELWWYYAIMATIGGLAGGYLTYRLGREGGKEALEKRISKKRAEKVYTTFERHGFLWISIGAVLPPPVPITPFLLAPGALQYPKKKFLAALALGRAIRYFLLAYLGSIYGRAVFRWMTRYYRPLLYILIGLSVFAGLVALYYWRRYKQQRRAKPGKPEPAHKAA